MATYAYDKNRSKPWRARRKRLGKEHFLGNYTTRQDAEEAERLFDIDNPPTPRANGYGSIGRVVDSGSTSV